MGGATIFKITLVILVLGLLSIGAYVWRSQNNLPQAAPVRQLPSDTATTTPSVDPASSSTTPTPITPTSISTAALPACQFKEYTIKILSSYDADPRELTLYLGDSVTFINNDTALHWPGADPHPTHSSLPSLDALGGISPGQTYSHTFNKLGVFGWHDHLLTNPPTVGHITVLPCK